MAAPTTDYQNVGSAERMAAGLGGGALVLSGLARRSPGGIALAALGGSLLYRAATGHCPLYQKLGVSTAEEDAGIGVVQAQKTVTISRPPAEVYEFVRTNLEQLPSFLKHVESIRSLGGGRWRWEIEAPFLGTVEVIEELYEERENERMAWRSLPESEIRESGTAEFRPAPGGRGTEVKVHLEYHPPAGALGVAIARFTGKEPIQQLEEGLRRLKHILEAGEIPTTKGQSSGRDDPSERSPRARDEWLNPVRPTDPVQEASEESFPASDPPSWTAGCPDTLLDGEETLEELSDREVTR